MGYSILMRTSHAIGLMIHNLKQSLLDNYIQHQR